MAPTGGIGGQTINRKVDYMVNTMTNAIEKDRAGKGVVNAGNAI